VKSMATVFEGVAREVSERALRGDEETGQTFLRKLDRRARTVLGLFSRQDEITTNDAARILGLSQRQVRNLLNEWVTAGWLEKSNSARKSRAYRLKIEYRQFIGNLSAK
jgi:Fic family protein